MNTPALTPRSRARTGSGVIAVPSWVVETTITGIVAVVLLLLVAFAAGRVGGTLATVAFPAGALISAALVVSRRLELSLAALLLYLGLLDGYLKLRLGGNMVTAGRDVLLYSIVVGVLARAAILRTPIHLPPYGLHVLLIILLVLVQGLNPHTAGVRGAVGGYRQHLEFVPLFVLGYVVLRGEDALRWLLVGFLVVVAANTVVAVIQYTLTPAQFARWGPGYADRILGLGAFKGAPRVFGTGVGVGHVRPFGLGSDFGTSGILGYLAVPGAIGLLSAARSNRGRALAALGLVGCVVGIIASQSRGAVLIGLVAAGFGLLVSVTPRTLGRTLGVILVSAAVVLITTTQFVKHNNTSSFSRLRTIAPGQVQTTISSNRGSSIALGPGYAVKYPLGDGIGRVGPAQGFGGVSVSSLNSETQFNFLIVEIGTGGMVAFALLFLRVLRDGVRLVRRAGDDQRRYLMVGPAGAVAAMCVGWFVGPVTASSPPAPLFWLFAGCIAWRMEQRATVSPQARA